jgi:AraC-like DNA-binding protein
MLSPSQIPSLPGHLRIAPLLDIPDLLLGFGVSPLTVFNEAGLALRVFTNPENRIDYAALGRLLDASSRRTGCAHFGLLVGACFDTARLGILGELMRNAPSVGAALTGLAKHLHVHDRGAAPVLINLSASQCLLGYSVYHHDLLDTSQIHDTAMVMAYRMLEELCGPKWKPRRVHFSRARPDAIQAYRGLFKCNLRFDAQMPGVIFDRRWLEQPIVDADPAAHARIEAILSAAQIEMGLGEQVERILLRLLPDGLISAVSVSRELGISERSLRRRLEDEGSKLQQIISQTRYEIARQLLLSTHLSIAEIAASLQYQDTNAFSRAFKRWAGISPLRWRLARNSTQL